MSTAPARSAGRALTVTVVDDLCDLEQLRDEWEQLLARSGGLHPSLTPTWLITWWRVFGSRNGRRMRVLVARDGRTLVGILPLVARRQKYHRVIPMRRLELIASGEDQADEILSEYLGPIAVSGREDEIVGTMIDRLSMLRGGWDEIVFSMLEGESPAVRALESALRVRGFSCETKSVGKCPFIALPPKWEDYLGALSSDDRYMAKRSLRDFEKYAGATGKVEVVRDHADLQRGKAILHRLHEHRWQSGGRDGVFASQAFTQFHDMLMPALLDRGELDLRWLVAHGEPIAVSYSVINDNRIFYYQGGRATELPKGVRPGIALHLYAIKAAIEAGRAEYDFLGGDARYKMQLSTGTRPLTELRVARRGLPEAALTALTKGRALLVEARTRVRGLMSAKSR